VEIVRSSKVRRAKRYYLRSHKGKAARLKDVERAVVATDATPTEASPATTPNS